MSWFQDFTGGLQNSGGDFAAGLVDAMFGGLKINRQVKAQKELTDYQNNASLKMTQSAPSAQKQGMLNAGLNPASGTYSGNVSSASPSAGDASANVSGKSAAANLAKAQEAVQNKNLTLQDKNIEVLQSAKDKNDADADLARAQAEAVRTDTKNKPREQEDAHNFANVQIRSMNQSIEESLSRIGVNDAQRVSLIRAADNYAASTRKIFEEINMMPQQIREILSRVNLNYVNARKADADTELSKAQKMLTDKRTGTEVWQHRLQAKDLEIMKTNGERMIFELEQMRKYYGSDKFFQYFGQVVGGVATGVSAASSFKYLSGKGSQNYAPSRVPYPDNTNRTFYTDY